MQHSDLKGYISDELSPSLSPVERVNEVVAYIGATEGSVKNNVDVMEKKLAELIGYKKDGHLSHEDKSKREVNSSMIRRAIAEAELDIWFNRRNHEQAPKYTGKRYMAMLYGLYGHEQGMENFVSKMPQEQVDFYVSKLDEALEKFPKITASDVSDREIVENFSTILDMYYLTADLNSAHAIFEQHPQGKELYEKYIAIQNNAALLNARAFLMANPYYSEIDFDQLLRTPIGQSQEPLMDLADSMDDALKDAIYGVQHVQQNLLECRKPTMAQFLPKEGEGTVAYFGADAKPLSQYELDNTLGAGLPLLAKVTGRDGTVAVKVFRPSSIFSANMEELTPEQHLAHTRGAGRAEIFDLASDLEKSKSIFRGSSDQFKDMTAAFERLYSHNLSSNAATPSTQNLLGSKDVLEELLESANTYLQFKAQRRAGTDTVADYSKLGKNRYEQDHINAALKLRNYARSRLDVHNLLEQDRAFMVRAAANEEALRNAPENSTRKDIANLRAACAQRNPEPWEVRKGGERVAQLHRAVSRDLRRLSELACLDRPLDAVEKAEVRTRMARAVALDLIRSERAGNRSGEMGNLERAAARSPEKFSAGIAGSKPFQKAMDNITPDKLKGMLSEKGIQTIRQGMLSQAASIGGKQTAPAKAPEAVQPTGKNAPQM